MSNAPPTPTMSLRAEDMEAILYKEVHVANENMLCGLTLELSGGEAVRLERDVSCRCGPR